MALIEITRLGNSVHIKDVSFPPSQQKLDKTVAVGTIGIFLTSDGQSPTSDDSLTIYHLGTAIGTFAATEFQTPSGATVEDLRDSLSAIFGQATQVAFADIQNAITNGTLPAGQHIFIPDICDEGAWFFCPTSTTISSAGQGLFLNCDENIEPLADWSSLNIVIEFDPLAVAGGTFNVGDNLTGSGNAWTGIIVALGNGTMRMYTSSFITAPGDYPVASDTIDNGTASVVADTVTMPASPYLPLATSGGRWHRQSEGFTVDGDSLDFKIVFDQLAVSGGNFPSKFVVGETVTQNTWDGTVTEIGDNYITVNSNSALGTYPIVGGFVDNGTVSVVIMGLTSAMSIGDAVSAPSGFTGAVVYVSGLVVTMASYNFGPGYSQPLVGEVVTSSSSHDMTVASLGGIGLRNGDVYVDFDTVANQWRHYQLVDVTLTNTNNPATCTTDIWLPLPIERGFGYLPVSNKIDFDFFHTDSVTGKGWLARRSDGLADIEYRYAMDAGYFDFGKSNVMAYRWGKSEWSGMVSTGYISTDTCYAAAIEGLEVGYRAYAQFSESFGATIASSTVGPRAYTLLDIAEGVTLSGLDIAAGITYLAKTFTQNIYGNVVTFSDTDAKTLTYAPENNLQSVVDISSAQLLGTGLGENIDTGITLIAGVLHGYPLVSLIIDFTYGTTQYGPIIGAPTLIQVRGKNSGVVLASFSATPLKAPSSQIIIVEMATGMNSVVGDDIILVTSTGAAFTGGDGTMRVTTNYERRYKA